LARSVRSMSRTGPEGRVPACVERTAVGCRIRVMAMRRCSEAQHQANQSPCGAVGHQDHGQSHNNTQGKRQKPLGRNLTPWGAWFRQPWSLWIDIKMLSRHPTKSDLASDFAAALARASFGGMAMHAVTYNGAVVSPRSPSNPPRSASPRHDVAFCVAHLGPPDIPPPAPSPSASARRRISAVGNRRRKSFASASRGLKNAFVSCSTCRAAP